MVDVYFGCLDIFSVSYSVVIVILLGVLGIDYVSIIKVLHYHRFINFDGRILCHEASHILFS